MRDLITFAAIVSLLGAAWFTGDVPLFGVGAVLVFLFCWETDR